MFVVQLSAVAIPADVGAVFVEVWSHVGYAVSPPGGQGSPSDAGFYVTEATAGVVIDARADTLITRDSISLYARSGDLSWAGSTRTVSVYIDGFHFLGGCQAQMAPLTLRIVRSY